MTRMTTSDFDKPKLTVRNGPTGPSKESIHNALITNGTSKINAAASVSNTKT